MCMDFIQKEEWSKKEGTLFRTNADFIFDLFNETYDPYKEGLNQDVVLAILGKIPDDKYLGLIH